MPRTERIGEFNITARKLDGAAVRSDITGLSISCSADTTCPGKTNSRSETCTGEFTE
jgi:hypothetical protein